MTRFILTAAEMRAAEAGAIAVGTPAQLLMERAGAAAAEAIRRFAGPLPALVLCGPGNNGGDGYVVARRLAQRGAQVRVAALCDPKSADAQAARAAWYGPVETLAEAPPAPLLVDALFGTGLARPLDESLSARLGTLAEAARIRVALDLPSGIATDDGRILSPVPDFDLTIGFAALKPSHLLQPAARHMGRLAVADIGIEARSRLSLIDKPSLRAPGPDDHKYRRGYLLVVGGAMPGAAALAAIAGARAGAGYVALVGDGGSLPNAVVRRPASDLSEALADPRVNAVLIGPGLGRDDEAWQRLVEAMSSPHPLILDGDALWLVAERGCPRQPTAPTIATPHSGEFDKLYGAKGCKIEAARAAAARSGHLIVYKGSDTVVAAMDGRAAVSGVGPAWLASAGTGDVLAGIVAAQCAAGLPAFEAACAGVWLHSRAAELAGPALVADDLPGRLAAAVGECL
ncbi:MAG: ADP-dependent NAD(P)H-hydrate dehydratase / NAD(P)H-hydrate epimerase [Sphingomonadales bacterium]|nr:ADP-dependent NAD(P)H-hydrate dehydratase / NAD(P)H-hydrate epimerase [Sphingomonadales bacterium]